MGASQVLSSALLMSPLACAPQKTQWWCRVLRWSSTAASWKLVGWASHGSSGGSPGSSPSGGGGDRLGGPQLAAGQARPAVQLLACLHGVLWVVVAGWCVC